MKPILMALLLGLFTFELKADPVQEAMAILDEVFKQVPKGTPTAADCNLTNDFNCTTAKVCHELRKNGDKQYLYVSEDGGKVPNLKAYSWLKNLDACAYDWQTRQNLLSTRTTSSADEDPILKSQKAMQDLTKQVVELGESDQMLLVQSVFNSQFGYFGTLTKDAFVKNIEEAQVLAS